MNKTQRKFRVSVVGASGYAGGELLRLLTGHPSVELRMLVSGSQAGKPLSMLFRGYGKSAKQFEALDMAKLMNESEVVFLAQENGFAMKHVPELIKAKLKVIDLSGDFRIKDAGTYQSWYKLEHSCPELLEHAVFGLPELFKQQLRGANLVANPGCYPTASILAIAPLLEERLIEPSSIIIDAKSGVSGAGRAKTGPDYHFPEVNESVRAYAVGSTHRHVPEIEQALSCAFGETIKISFTPHLIPMTRGILATCYGTLVRNCESRELLEIYHRRYKDEPFVVVFPEGECPTTKGCCASNQCHIGIAVDSRTRRVTVLSAIDNLVKGAAGQAVQNMNLMLDLPEIEGLDLPGIWP